MPYADPEKHREAQRRYEQGKRAERRTNWMLVFYEDRCPEWREELDELGLRTVVSPSHDADEWTARDEKKNPKHKAGTLKEPHRHLLAMYDNPVSYDQVVKDFAFLKSKNVKYVKSLPAMARYLTHMDSPDKAQYDPEGVCEFGGADWR
ncbi:Rep family protein, partial [Eggerthella sp.]